MTRIFVILTAAILGFSSPALAHAHLTKSDPAANAVVASPKALTLHFSEKLSPKFSGMTVTMPQMNNMTAAAKVTFSKDRLNMVAMPAEPLSPGVYKVSWHAVAADTHRMEGDFSFTVR